MTQDVVERGEDTITWARYHAFSCVMQSIACYACLEFTRCDCKSKKVVVVSIVEKKKNGYVPNFVDGRCYYYIS